MGRVTYGQAWLEAWKHAPQAVRGCVRMTRASIPVTKLMKHGVMPLVLGDKAPKQLVKNATLTSLVDSALIAQLIAAVQARGAELEHCRELYELVHEARTRLQLHSQNVSETNAMIVRSLWPADPIDPAVIDQAVREFFGSRTQFDDSGHDITKDPQTIAEQNAELLKHWPVSIPVRSPDALSEPADLIYWHKHIGDDHWAKVVNWVGEHELRGWEYDLGLTARPKITLPPPAQGPDESRQPLDRSLQAWISNRIRRIPSKQRPPRDQLVAEEIICATSSLGLPTDEARAIILLGYWLVRFHSFTANPNDWPDKEMVDQYFADRDWVDQQKLVKMRYVLMMRAVWATFRRNRDGTIQKPAVDRVVTTEDGGYSDRAVAKSHDGDKDADIGIVTVDHLGEQMLDDPLRSFMKRLWAKVHARSHRTRITASQASILLRNSWESWVQDAAAAMAKAAQPPPPDPTAVESLLLQQLTGILSRDPQLGKDIMASADLASLAPRWETAVQQAIIEPHLAVATEIADWRVVSRYLATHLKSASAKKGLK